MRDMPDKMFVKVDVFGHVGEHPRPDTTYECYPIDEEGDTEYTRTDLVDELVLGMMNAIEMADYCDDDSGNGANNNAYNAAYEYSQKWLRGDKE